MEESLMDSPQNMPRSPEPDFAEFIREALQLSEMEPEAYSPLALAYIGDAVYELIVRTRIMSRGNTQVNKMHKKSAQLVNAKAQAEMIRMLMDELSEEEIAVYKRGRNAKSATSAKHATVIDYRTATGFEALCGYLYLCGRMKRLITLVGHGLSKLGELK